MKKYLVLATLCATTSLAASPTEPSPTEPLLHTVNGAQYVNPFNFAQAHGGKISGKSVDKEWVISFPGKTLRLLNNSATAYLNGQRVTLSKVVGYARGTLLAPHADLVRLLGVGERAKAETPKLQSQKVQAPATVRPLVGTAVPTSPQPAPAPTEAAVSHSSSVALSTPAPLAARPTRNAGTGAYIIQSDVPSRTDALERSNFQQDIDPQTLNVDTVVQACQSGVARSLGEGAPTFAARPFVFVHPGDVYSVRSSAGLEAQGQSSRTSFTCLSQVQGAKLVMFIELSGR